MIDYVAGCAMIRLKVNGQGAQTAVASEPKRRMLVEDLTIEMYAYVGLHVLGTIVEHLGRVDAFRDGPRRHDVVHDALLQLLWHVVQLHELAYVVEHFVVASRR